MHYHKKAFAKKNETTGERITVESYVVIIKNMGFSVGELKYFDVGDILDVADEMVKDKSSVREATQEDFDRF